MDTGCNALNLLIKGYKNEITALYGAAATGKTTLAKIAALSEITKGNKILFLDTENGFSVERFKQLAGKGYKNLLDDLFIFKIKNFKDQQLKIKNLENLIKKSKISLVIVDTIGFYYRVLLKRKKDLANNMLTSQLKILNHISKDIPVLITNQVYTNIKKGRIDPVGGDIIKKFSNCIIKLEKDPRKMILERPDKKEIYFEIRDDGIFKI